MAEAQYGPDMQKEMDKERRYWKKNYLWTFAILIGAALYFFFTSPAITTECGETSLRITAPDSIAAEIPYDDFTDVSWLEAPEYGTCTEGFRKKSYGYGTWQNAEWGQYTRFTYDKPDCCVVLTTEDGVTVVNAESRSDTEALYQSILSQIS